MYSITMKDRIIIHEEIIKIFIDSIPSLFKYSSDPYGVSLKLLDDDKNMPYIIKITNVTNQGLSKFQDFFHKLNFKWGEEFNTHRYFDDYYIKDHDMKLVNQEYKNFLETYDEKIKINLSLNIMQQAIESTIK